MPTPVSKPSPFKDAAFKSDRGTGKLLEDKRKRVFPTRHPHVKNKDGSESNVKIMGVGMEGKEYQIPTMVEGKDLSPREAVAIARKKGLKNYPSFKTVEEGEKWAKENHDKIDEMGYERRKPVGNIKDAVFPIKNAKRK